MSKEDTMAVGNAIAAETAAFFAQLAVAQTIAAWHVYSAGHSADDPEFGEGVVDAMNVIYDNWYFPPREDSASNVAQIKQLRHFMDGQAWRQPKQGSELPFK